MEMLGLNITVQDDDVVSVMGDLYVKTAPALERLLEELKAAGYTVNDLREDDWRKRDGVTIEEMEQKGWSLWYASIMSDIRRGKCKSCGSYISLAGIRTHGHTCEVCGEVTYLDIVDGTRIRFEFLNEAYQGMMFAPQLNMTARRWDTEEGYLYFYLEFHGGGLSVVEGERAEQYLAENSGLWEKVQEDDLVLLKVRYPNPWRRDVAAIEPYDSSSHYFNYTEVKIWNGQEYRDWDRLPIPESISVYEAWHWMPVEKSPTIHSRILHAARQTDDKSYFYQDGRPYYTEGHWREMAKFVRHFTDLDADAFDKAWPRFRHDGPGGIDDLARFCHEAPVVTNRPNMWNTVLAFANVMEGKPLTDQEAEAAIRGMNDPAADDIFTALGRSLYRSGALSGGIEAQEAAGQQDFVNSATLPSDMRNDTRQILEASGVIILDEVENDPMFVNVEMPSGWKKIASDHDMWSYLVDNFGRTRASIFYKASWHDRNAFIRADKRFRISAEVADAGHAFARVYDQGNLVHTTKAAETQHDATVLAEDWLNEYWPGWENPAKWDWYDEPELSLDEIERGQWYNVKTNPKSEAAKRIAGQLVGAADRVDKKTKTVPVFTLDMFANKSGVAIRLPVSDLTYRHEEF